MPSRTITSKNTSYEAEIKFSVDEQYVIQQREIIVTSASVNELTVIDTQGDAGKPGKIGKDGVDGKPGQNGRNARRYMGMDICGTDGQPGSPGTDGEPGGHGGDGRDGGDITIAYHQDESDLVDALQLFAQGGAGGQKGIHGRGGKGGKGGRGGDADTYMAEFSHHPHCYYDPLHPWEWRTIPGGRSGRDGANGVTPNSELENGRAGRDGRITYRNIETNQSYNQRYQHKFVAITVGGTHLADLSKRKFEYGESVFISGITLANEPQNHLLSAMPTPENNQVYLTSSSSLVQPQGQTHVREILPHTQAICDSDIDFKITHPCVSVSQVQKSESLPLQLHVLNPRLKRDYQGASAAYAITVGYPVYLEALPGHMSVFSGSQLSITSLVSHDPAFPGISADTRPFKVQLQRHDREDGVSTSKQTRWEESFSHQGSSVVNENLYISLWWPKLDTGEWTEIQRQTVQVQITPKYTSNCSGYLLVINAETPKALVDAWYQRLYTLAYGYSRLSEAHDNQGIPIWNVSTYDQLNLADASYPLAQHTSNGTIVILGNRVKHHGQIRYNSTWMQEDSLHAARKNHVRLVHAEVVSENNSLETMDAQNRLDRSFEIINIHSIPELMGHLFQRPVDSREIYSLTLKPAEDRGAIKRKVQQMLQHTFPNRRYAVVIDNSNVCIQQMLAPCVARLENHVTIERDLIQASPFVQKLQTVFRHANGIHAQHKTYLEAILKDLKEERTNLAKSDNFYSLYKSYYHDFTKELICLNQLLEQVKKMDADQLQAFTPHLIQLVVEIQQEAKNHTSFWTWLASFFVAQNDEKLKASTQYLSNQILEKMTQVDVYAKSKVALQLKLRHYLGQENNHVFFKPGKTEDFAAARELLQACESNISLEGTRSKRLQSFYNEFASCYRIN